MDRASDAGLKALGARGVGRKQQSTDHFPVAILVNQLIFSCFRLVRVTIAVTKEPRLCILYSHEHNDVRFIFFFSFFKQRPYCKSPISLLQVLYRYILICHTVSTLTPIPENIRGETHWSTLSSQCSLEDKKHTQYTLQTSANNEGQLMAVQRGTGLMKWD